MIEFSLFSTGSGPAKVSLSEPSFEVPVINRRRSEDHYFTNPYTPLSFTVSDGRNDKERISQLVSVAVTASDIIELSNRPWVVSPLWSKLMSRLRNGIHGF